MIDYPLRFSPKSHAVLPARMQGKTSVATMHYTDWAEDSVCCTICVKFMNENGSQQQKWRSSLEWNDKLNNAFRREFNAVGIMCCRIFGWMLILEQNFLKLLYWRERFLVQAIYNGFTGTQQPKYCIADGEIHQFIYKY